MKMLKNKSKLDKVIFFVGVAMILTGIILAISDNSHVNGSGTSYENMQVVKNLAQNPNEEIVLYAQWNKKNLNKSLIGIIYRPIKKYISIM